MAILYCYFTFELVPGFPRLFDRTFVLNGRDVTRVAIECDGAQHAAHNLAAARLGQRADNFDLANDRYGTQFTAHRIEQFFAQFLRGLIPLLEHDKSRNHFAAQFIGTSSHACFCNSGMHQEGCLDLDSTNAMTSNLDNLVGAAREPYIAIFINGCRVTRVIDTRKDLPIVVTVPLRLAP